MKTYIHARLSRQERAALEALKRATGRSESEIVRRGLQLAAEESGRQRSALALAGSSAGRFTTGPLDLSTNKAHLGGFGR